MRNLFMCRVSVRCDASSRWHRPTSFRRVHRQVVLLHRRCKNFVDASVSRSVWHAGSHKDAGGGPRAGGGGESDRLLFDMLKVYFTRAPVRPMLSEASV